MCSSTTMLRAVAQTKFLLDESQLPRRWYNVRADMPNPMQPILHPGTGQPVGPDDLAPLFPMELILQEVSEEPEIAIPEEVLDIYRLWRPTPLYRAHRLEQARRDALADLLQVRGRQPGRQPQAEHRGRAGLLQQAGGPHAPRDRDRRGPVGQRARVRLQAARARVQGLHGSRLVRPEAVPALDDPDVGRGRSSPSPSEDTNSGRAVLAEHPDSPGSLGIAISEAVEDAADATTPRTRSAACSTTCCCTRP